MTLQKKNMFCLQEKSGFGIAQNWRTLVPKINVGIRNDEILEVSALKFES